MKSNNFFKPTPIYKEYIVLETIEKKPDITQRELSRILSVAVSMINGYLDTYETKGYLKKEYKSSKVVQYHITKAGIERKKVLNIGYLRDTQRIYKSAKEDVLEFLNNISNQGFKSILLYGAGEVAEILLQTINDDANIPLNVVSVIDDDLSKVGKTLVNKTIIAKEDIKSINHDGILISSYTNHKSIYRKLMDVDYDKSKIVYFFT